MKTQNLNLRRRKESSKQTVILTSSKESFQNEEASRVIVNGKNTHSYGKSITGILHSLNALLYTESAVLLSN